ncbi:MAG: hypothetical protein IKE21_03185 [Erysipelotrichaceae bacterium]|nr:hypothetical protein [Erysipelotrichaceae bacterium]
MVSCTKVQILSPEILYIPYAQGELPAVLSGKEDGPLLLAIDPYREDLFPDPALSFLQEDFLLLECGAPEKTLPGSEEELQTWQEAIRFFRKERNYKGPVGVLGSSYGGYGAFYTALREECESVLLLSAPADWDSYQWENDLPEDYLAQLGSLTRTASGDGSAKQAENREYTGEVLLVQGANDHNVSLQQTQRFREQCTDLHLLLHQDGHSDLLHDAPDLLIGDQTARELVRQWFRETLSGEGSSLPAVLQQSNIDGKFSAGTEETEEKVCPLFHGAAPLPLLPFPYSEKETAVLSEQSLCFERMETGLLQGNPLLALSFAGEIRSQRLCAALYDIAEEPFPAYLLQEELGEKLPLSADGRSFRQTLTKRKLISFASFPIRERMFAGMPPVFYELQEGHRLQLCLWLCEEGEVRLQELQLSIEKGMSPSLRYVSAAYPRPDPRRAPDRSPARH